MSDEFISKYQKESESMEMELSLDNYVLLPDSKAKCKIIIKPKFNFKIKQVKLEIILRLTQFEKYEIKNDYNKSSRDKDTLLLEKKYLKLLPKSISNDIIFDDIEFEVPSYSNNLLFPTFEFRNEESKFFVRHLLTVEIHEFEIINSIGVIICKLPAKIYKLEKKNSNIFKDEILNTYLLKNEGKISYNISLKKQVYNPKEEIPIIICINSSELKEINIESIELILKKKIKIHLIKLFSFGTEQEVIMDKKIFNKFKTNQNVIKLNTELKFKKIDIPELTDNEILKYTNFDENFVEIDNNRTQLNPSMNGNLFKCEYKLKINFSFNNFYGKTITESFILDIYDLYNINPENIPNNLKHYFLIKENKLFNTQKSLNEKEKEAKDNKNNNSNEKNKTDIQDFVVFDYEDIFKAMEENK